MSDDIKADFEDNPDFNQWLEENYDVEIDEYIYPSSSVLYKMNTEHYMEALERFKNDPKIAVSRIQNYFPTPIAYYLYQANNTFENNHHRLDSLKSCWESIIFILYGLVVGEARHRKLDLHSFGITKYKTLLNYRLFNKLTVIENILDYTEKSGIEFECLEIVPVEIVSIIKRLNEERNGFEHAFAKTSDQQQTLYDELYPQLILVLGKLAKLEEVQIFRYHEADTPLYPRCEIFLGLNGKKDTIFIRPENFTEIMEYFNAKSVFAKIKDTVFCLSPFIHFSKEKHETNASLCFFKQIESEKYQFEITGKSQQKDFEETAFSLMISQLKYLVSDKLYDK